MKVWVYRWDDGEFKFWDRGDVFTKAKLIGTLDLDVKPEKKWVKKKTVLSYEDMVTSGDHFLSNIFVPKGARNLILSYEVEE
jgi:hypothetical protein